MFVLSAVWECFGIRCLSTNIAECAPSVVAKLVAKRPCLITNECAINSYALYVIRKLRPFLVGNHVVDKMCLNSTFLRQK